MPSQRCQRPASWVLHQNTRTRLCCAEHTIAAAHRTARPGNQLLLRRTPIQKRTLQHCSAFTCDESGLLCTPRGAERKMNAVFPACAPQRAVCSVCAGHKTCGKSESGRTLGTGRREDCLLLLHGRQRIAATDPEHAAARTFRRRRCRRCRRSHHGLELRHRWRRCRCARHDVVLPQPVLCWMLLQVQLEPWVLQGFLSRQPQQRLPLNQPVQEVEPL